MAECTCGADKFEGAQHQGDCPVPNSIPSAGRRTLEDPGSSFTRVRFIEGGGVAQIDSYQPDGSTAEILAGTLQCLLIGTRIVDTVHGPGMVADVAITEPAELAGVEASFFCSSMLSRLMEQVPAGTEVEITRLADRSTKAGRAHQYQVDILGDNPPEPEAVEAGPTISGQLLDTGPVAGKEH